MADKKEVGKELQLVPPINPIPFSPDRVAEARKLVDAWRTGVVDTWAALEKIVFEEAWKPLGYESLEQLIVEEAPIITPKIPREVVEKIVFELSDEGGVSIRAIARTTGLSKSRVGRMLKAKDEAVPSGTNDQLADDDDELDPDEMQERPREKVPSHKASTAQQYSNSVKKARQMLNEYTSAVEHFPGHLRSYMDPEDSPALQDILTPEQAKQMVSDLRPRVNELRKLIVELDKYAKTGNPPGLPPDDDDE